MHDHPRPVIILPPAPTTTIKSPSAPAFLFYLLLLKFIIIIIIIIVIVIAIIIIHASIYNNVRTNKNQPPGLHEKLSTIFEETKCKLTDFNLFLYKLGVPWCARKVKYKIS